MTAPREVLLALMGPIVQVTTYGGPRDPFRWIRDRYTWRGDVLEVERAVMSRGTIPMIEVQVTFPGRGTG